MKKTLYLECNSGISGDMTVGALLDLGADRKVLEDALASLHVDGYEIKIGRTFKCGIDACDFDVILDESAYVHDHGEHDHEHEHTHTHEHTHDGVAHTHPHTHEHTHDHEHPHDHAHLHADGAEHTHSHDCGQDCASCASTCEHTPMEELVALMKYMVGHNAAHAKELADLAVQLDKAGDHTAYEQVMAAVSDFEKGNMRLSVVLSSLEVK